MKCEKCQYEWKNRQDQPKSCPRCKRRFDYPKTSPDVKEPQEGVVKNQKEVDKNE